MTRVASALDAFSPVARAWFADAFAAPTRAQELGWASIAKGHHTLLLAPTGSGKTLAAFLWCLDRLSTEAIEDRTVASRRGGRKRVGVRTLYVSPLKALSYDVERNLRAPLAGLRLAAAREGLPMPDVTVATRTGDTPTAEREDIRRDPPDILITTPESLYLMLTSRAREILRTVDTVIVDEIHTMAATKRGAHLALSLERLETLTGRPFQRIGLSATQRPLEEVARYLGGGRPVEIADAGASRDLDLRIVVPVEDMARPDITNYQQPGQIAGTGYEGGHSIWPAVYPQLVDLVKAHTSTLIFVNNRRLAERLALRVNELAGEELLLAHHGSVSREQRQVIEDRLKAGLIPGLVCTSSMELGIDMGAVDLVVMVESPRSVARGLQRVGRAGHQVGGVSTGRLFPKWRGDLLECAVVASRMRQGLIEATEVPRNPLDVLAQQLVAMTALEAWTVAEIEALVRRAYNFSTLSREQLEGVLGMLAGHYPSDEFADLKPRIIWDRERDVVEARSDGRTIAVINAGTIPDRGLYGVFLGEDGPRVGELDEEMVYESRAGETFLLGATTWRIEQITRDRVIVSPAPGEPGKMPFWKGDGIGRPLELGRAVGQFTREVASERDDDRAIELLQGEYHLDRLAAENLVAYLAEEREATGALPTDRSVVVQRFRDELGDWRMVLLSPFGGRVHSPWAQAIEAVLSERSGFDVQTLWSDDGIAIRLAGADELPAESLLFPEPGEVEELVVNRLADTALFAAHFRENAGRALLLPKRRPGARSPLWLQRQRSANLLGVASRYGSFPIILETYRECLRDVFDMPGLKEVLGGIHRHEIRVHTVETSQASPFARSLLFDYVAAYMYEGDAPLAERRAQALTLDRNLLRDLLGEDELRELLDPAALDETELELQCLVDGRRARNADQLHDLLRRLGDLTMDELRVRSSEPERVEDWLAVLRTSHRAHPVRIAGEERWIPAEDAGRYRDGLGVAPPPGVPEAFLRPAEDPLGGLVARFARTHGPFLASDVAGRWEIPERLIAAALDVLERAGTVVHGDFRPGGRAREWCDADVLRTLRRRSLARLRREVEPVDTAAYARFSASWHRIGSQEDGTARLREVVAQLEGYALPASSLERDILANRCRDYRSSQLDELCASGEVAWVGRAALGRDDGKVCLYRRERAPLFLEASLEPPADELQAAVLGALERRGASFFLDIVRDVKASHREVLDAFWSLVWDGRITNDTFAPVRALAWPRHEARGPRRHGSPIPPEAMGRWWAVSSLAEPVTPTGRVHALATTLLDRYGVVTREAVAAEGVPGGFSSVYGVLKAMEEGGRIRRGYFVEGMGAAQFALSGAVERLRAAREPGDESAVRILAATDPANPYGAAILFPRRPDDERRNLARVAGARVITVDGVPVAYLDRAGKGIVTLPAWDDPRSAAAAVSALIGEHTAAVPLSIERLDGMPAGESPRVPPFFAAGFVPALRGITYRRPRQEVAVAGRR
jgi:ATP-dependent Lhr-like helicase